MEKMLAGTSSNRHYFLTVSIIMWCEPALLQQEAEARQYHTIQHRPWTTTSQSVEYHIILVWSELRRGNSRQQHSHVYCYHGRIDQSP
jgi:hypothetical protein